MNNVFLTFDGKSYFLSVPNHNLHDGYQSNWQRYQMLAKVMLSILDGYTALPSKRQHCVSFVLGSTQRWSNMDEVKTFLTGLFKFIGSFNIVEGNPEQYEHPNH